MAAYMETSHNLLRCFTSWTLNSMERLINHWVDALSKLATTAHGKAVTPVYIIDLESLSINKTDVYLIHDPEYWRTPLIRYIQGNLTNVDQKQQHAIAFKARN